MYSDGWFASRYTDPEGVDISFDVAFRQSTSVSRPHPDLRPGDAAEGSTDVISAVPRMIILFGGESMRVAEMLARVQAKALGASVLESGEAHFPIHVEISERARGVVAEDTVEIQAHGLLSGRTFKVHERFTYFLRVTNCLAVFIAGGNALYGVTVPLSEHVAIPTVASHKGSLQAPTFNQLAERSSKWFTSAIENLSALAGGSRYRDDHFYEFGATPREHFLPERVSYMSTCLVCGGSPVSREHCTPNWLTGALKSMPLVAPILCEACNNVLGRDIERPIADLWMSGAELTQEQSLHRLWAYKTAVLCSLACHVQVPPDLAAGLRDRFVPSSFIVEVRTDLTLVNEGYQFQLATFTDL